MLEMYPTLTTLGIGDSMASMPSGGSHYKQAKAMLDNINSIVVPRCNE